MGAEAASWVGRWSQREQANEYIRMGHRALMGIDFRGLHHACIFNCSDGPSTAGLIAGIKHTQPAMAFTISDISPVAVVRCGEFLAADKIITSPAVVISPTDSLPFHLQHMPDTRPVDAYASFEPVGDSEDTYEKMWDTLPAGGRIVVAARGYLNHSFRYIRALARSLGRDFDMFDPGVRSPKGNLITVFLSK